MRSACRVGACEVCEQRPHGTCARCGEAACSRCDRCAGCRELICRTCDTAPAPSFDFPGDQYRHPHVDDDGTLTLEDVA